MIHSILAAVGIVLALGPNPGPTIDPTGAHAADVAKQAIGNLFLAVLAVLGVWALLRRRMLEVVGLVALAVVCGMFVYFPSTIQAIAAAVVKVLEGG